MLSQRYINDGLPTLKLNALQRELREQVAEKLFKKIYNLEDSHCCVCEIDRIEKLSEKDRYGLEMHVSICRDCGLIFTTPRMSQASYAEFYDSEYRPLYHGYEAPYSDLFSNQYQSRGPKIAHFLQTQGVKLKGKRVYEVGCGAGGILAFLRDTFECKVGGCDFGTEAISFGRKFHQLDLQEGALASINMPWKPDILIYCHVFEHILDLRKECDSMKFTLNGDGIVYIEVPSVKNIRSAYNWDFLRLLQNAHTYHFTLTTLTNVMARCGFSCIGGTEFVRALYRPSKFESKIVNDYDSVTAFLKTTERWRPIMSRCIRLRTVRNQVREILVLLGVFGLVRRLLKRPIRK